MDIWWLCQGEKIIVYPSYYLGVKHSWPYLFWGWIYVGMKVFGRYIDQNGIEYTKLKYCQISTSY